MCTVSPCLSCFQLVYRCLSFTVQLLRHVHLRLTMILRVDVRSSTAKENTYHAVTCPRMVAELVFCGYGPRELFVLLEQQRRCFWMEEFVQWLNMSRTS